ncbi:MAG TPA: hypothetical protein PK323_05965 [Bacteroidia bacterium]|nr:hypothetical protein [Bacteroidia bacterium]
MSLDKKAILKEIEVLIRSIKVHYDNIENEHRIPTIELELITSKIRKLHEKSIIYNHLHYLEEEQLQSARRLKLDQLIFKHGTETQVIEPIELVHKKNEIFDTQVKFEEKVMAIEQEKKEEPSNLDVEIKANTPLTEKKETTNTSVKDHVEENFKPINLNSKIGINDRFRFIKNLFGGNGTAMEESIKLIENCSSKSSLTACLNSIKSQYNWNDEDETVIDFLGLVE